MGAPGVVHRLVYDPNHTHLRMLGMQPDAAYASSYAVVFVDFTPRSTRVPTISPPAELLRTPANPNAPFSYSDGRGGFRLGVVRH